MLRVPRPEVNLDDACTKMYILEKYFGLGREVVSDASPSTSSVLAGHYESAH